MANITYAAGQSAPFDTATDALQVTDLSLAAAGLQFLQSGANLQVGFNGVFMTLLDTSYASLTSASITFADGSQFLAGTAAADSLAGTVNGDFLDLSAGGADNASGGNGND